MPKHPDLRAAADRLLAAVSSHRESIETDPDDTVAVMSRVTELRAAAEAYGDAVSRASDWGNPLGGLGLEQDDSDDDEVVDADAVDEDCDHLDGRQQGRRR